MSFQTCLCRLDEQNELILFRMMQECFNNIIKHADATEIEVLCNYEPGLLVIAISDNSKGFDAQTVNGHTFNGLGLRLRNLPGRAKLIGATFELQSQPGNGTAVQIKLPIQNN